MFVHLQKGDSQRWLTLSASRRNQPAHDVNANANSERSERSFGPIFQNPPCVDRAWQKRTEGNYGAQRGVGPHRVVAMQHTVHHAITTLIPWIRSCHCDQFIQGT